MELLTGRQMRRADEIAITERGIAGLDLMEAAGGGVAAAMLEDIPGLASRHLIVLCGKGNNGGDGLVVARHLAQAGVPVRVLLLARFADLKGDAASNVRRARSAGLAIEEIPDEAAWVRGVPSPRANDVVVDALLGTGVEGGARDLTARVIDDAGGWPATVVAVDLPSGASADRGRIDGPVMRAHATYTLCRPKLGLVLEPAASHAGPWRVIDIGIPDDVVASVGSRLEWFDAPAASKLAPARPPGSHKGMMGHLLVVAGSLGKSGAATIACRAALRSGAGLVTAAVPRAVQAVVAASQAEAMTEGLPTWRAAAPRVLALLRSRDALALGPGLGTGSEVRSAVASILSKRRAPCVLDADGLNAFATDRRSRARLRAGRFPLVITPHPGEAGRLLDRDPASVQAGRLEAALELAATIGAVTVLKGQRSIVAHPDGRAAFVASGNPGMATAGTGDALTGVIGALLARGLAPFDAARLGTYVHGAAGDAAAACYGFEGLIAGDLIDALPDAWQAIAALR